MIISHTIKRPENNKISGAIVVASAFLLSACGTIDRDNNLRFWENARYRTDQEMQKHHYKSAKKNALEALARAETFGSTDYRLGISLCNLGDVYKAEGAFPKAEHSYKKAIDVLTEATKAASSATFKTLIAEDRANALSHLADLYASNEKFKKAAKAFEDAVTAYEPLVVSSQNGVRDCIVGQDLVQCLNGLAQMAVHLNNPEEAIKSYDKALRFAMLSNTQEFLLRDIRDAYVKLLIKMGREEKARGLVADSLWVDYTLRGMKAERDKDYHSAEIFLTKALLEAQLSFFADRRIMSSTNNLVNIYLNTGQNDSAEKICLAAIDYKDAHNIRFDRQFEQVMHNLAGVYRNKMKFAQANAILEQQLRLHVKANGPSSYEVAEIWTRIGQNDISMHKYQAAKDCAQEAYQILNPTHLSDKRASLAVNQTAILFELTGDWEKAEFLYKTELEEQSRRMEPGDVRLTAYSVQLMNFYHKCHNKAAVKEMTMNMLERLKKANPTQRANAFPYIELAVSIMLSDGGYDEAVPLAEFGQSLLRNELAGAQLEASSEQRWHADIKKMEMHFGRKF